MCTGGASKTDTTQSEHAKPRTWQVSQSMITRRLPFTTVTSSALKLALRGDTTTLTSPEGTDRPHYPAQRMVVSGALRTVPAMTSVLPSAIQPSAIQGTLDGLEVDNPRDGPLHTTTFVVVDLETTGGSVHDSEITEIGAVKVRGGEVLGEFGTLVRPTSSIPPFVQVLTGITDAMVASAPPIAAVLPAFLEFADGAVLVAHNAPFDIGFLKAACAALHQPWPRPAVLDTARLARRSLSRDEAPNCKLATLARVFRSSTTPDHRALHDARATVDVFHGLLERLGNVGVTTVDEARQWQYTVTPAQRRKRALADHLPDTPGVYVFTDDHGAALYVGKSKHIRTRVRSYFTASETRRRMTEMVAIATQVNAIECATPLEAEVRELRLIAERKPRYNRRSRYPEKSTWLKVTVEPFPRLSVVRKVRDDGAVYVGPFTARKPADDVMTAVHEAVPIRQCTARLSPSRPGSSCVLFDLGRCGAPCIGAESAEGYSRHVDHVRRAFTADIGPIVDTLLGRIRTLAVQRRYEDAARHRDRLATLLRATARAQRHAALAAVPLLVAARRREIEGGWEIHVVRHGRLAGAGTSPRGADPRPFVDSIVATAETVPAPPQPLPAAGAEEVDCVLRWLDQPGTRLVRVDGTWTLPVDSAAAHQRLLEPVGRDRRAADPFADGRRLGRGL